MSATRTEFPFVIASLNSRRRWNKPAGPIVNRKAKMTIPSESPTVTCSSTASTGPSKLRKPKTVGRPPQTPLFKEALKTALSQRIPPAPGPSTSAPHQIRPRREGLSATHSASKIPTKPYVPPRAPIPTQTQTTQPIVRIQAPAKLSIVRPVKATVLKSLIANAPIPPRTASCLSFNSSSDAKYSYHSTAATSPIPSPASREQPRSNKCESRGRIPVASFVRPEGGVKEAAAESGQDSKPAQKQSAAADKVKKAAFSPNKALHPPTATPARTKAPRPVARMTLIERKPGSTQSPKSNLIEEYLARLQDKSAPALSPATPALSFCSSAHSTPSEIISTPFGARRIRRLVIPALDEHRVVSRNEDIRREVDALRTQKRVAGGGLGLAAGEEGISLKALSIINRVRRDAGKDALAGININRDLNEPAETTNRRTRKSHGHGEDTARTSAYGITNEQIRTSSDLTRSLTQS